MDTLQQFSPMGLHLFLLVLHPIAVGGNVRGCAVAVCDIWLNNFRLQNVSESQGKVDFPAHVCVCVFERVYEGVCVCGSNFIIGFPSAIKILRIFKSIYRSRRLCSLLRD